MRKYNIPIFIPHRGCPHDCVFCNQRKITGVDTEVIPGQVRVLILEFLSTIEKENSIVEVAFFGGSFTGMNLKLQEEFLRVASEFFPYIDGIRISTRPDYINDDVISLLNRYNVTTVELGVQSTNDTVLEMNNRAHSFGDVIRATEMLKHAGIEVGHQMMIGMYGSDCVTDIQTVRDIISLKPSCVRIYPVVTLKDTQLEKLYSQGKYIPYTVDEAAEITKEAIALFRESKIEVIRIGLHASDELDSDNNVVAGPYHPAFGEICESLIYRDKIEKELLNVGEKNGEFVFKCVKRDVSKAIGHKKMNSVYFYKKYGVRLKITQI